MNYEEAMEYIRGTAVFGTKLGLDNIRILMSLLRDPQEKLKCIHIAGTNGKGSVAAYMLAVMENAGLKVGFYTSPELSRFSERIRINEEEISDGDVAKYATSVRRMAEYMTDRNLGSPSEFELVLAMAFCYFLDRGVDAVILETGLGGRLDATNVIGSSVLSVITKISYDHMQYLGDTLTQIASEKAAIIKKQGKVIVYPAKDEIMNVFIRRCREQEAELYIAELPTSRRLLKGKTFPGCSGQEFVLQGDNYVTKMLGIYETDNASLAIQAVKLLRHISEMKEYSISDDDIYEGIQKAFWPGRFEILSDDPVIIADGAHNEDGAAALASTLRDYMGGKKITLCIGILRDKQYDRMLAKLLPLADRAIVCEVPNPRSLGAKELADVIRKADKSVQVIISNTPWEAFDIIKSLQHEAAAFVICGSLYLVGPMREYIHKISSSL